MSTALIEVPLPVFRSSSLRYTSCLRKNTPTARTQNQTIDGAATRLLYFYYPISAYRFLLDLNQGKLSGFEHSVPDHNYQPPVVDIGLSHGRAITLHE